MSLVRTAETPDSKQRCYPQEIDGVKQSHDAVERSETKGDERASFGEATPPGQQLAELADNNAAGVETQRIDMATLVVSFPYLASSLPPAHAQAHGPAAALPPFGIPASAPPPPCVGPSFDACSFSLSLRSLTN